jgi:hypothetical protein
LKGSTFLKQSDPISCVGKSPKSPLSPKKSPISPVKFHSSGKIKNLNLNKDRNLIDTCFQTNSVQFFEKRDTFEPIWLDNFQNHEKLMDLCHKQEGYPVLTEYIIKNKEDWFPLQKQGLVQVQTTASAFSFDKILTDKRIIKIDKSKKGVDSKNKELKVVGMIKTLRVKGDIENLKRASLTSTELYQKKTLDDGGHVNKFYQKKMTSKNARFRKSSSINKVAGRGRNSSVYLNDSVGPPNPAIQTPNIVFVNKQNLTSKSTISYEKWEIDDIEAQNCEKSNPLWGTALVNRKKTLGSNAHGVSGEPSQTRDFETLSPIYRNPDLGGMMNFDNDQVIKTPAKGFELAVAQSGRLNPRVSIQAMGQKSGFTQFISTDRRSSVDKNRHDSKLIIGMVGSLLFKVGKAEIANRR